MYGRLPSKPSCCNIAQFHQAGRPRKLSKIRQLANSEECNHGDGFDDHHSHLTWEVECNQKVAACVFREFCFFRLKPSLFVHVLHGFDAKT